MVKLMKSFWNGFINRNSVSSVLKGVSVVDFAESVFRSPLKTVVQQIFVKHIIRVFRAIVLFQTLLISWAQNLGVSGLSSEETKIMQSYK